MQRKKEVLKDQMADYVAANAATTVDDVDRVRRDVEYKIYLKVIAESKDGIEVELCPDALVEEHTTINDLMSSLKIITVRGWGPMDNPAIEMAPILARYAVEAAVAKRMFAILKQKQYHTSDVGAVS